MNSKKRRSAKNIDGFFKKPDPLIANHNQPPSTPFPGFSNAPRRRNPPKFQSQGSLLSTTLPNRTLSRPTTTKNDPPIPEETKKGKRSRKKAILKVVLAFIIIVVGLGFWLGWGIIGNIDKVFHGNLLSDAKALFSTTKLKGETDGRVNILLAGDSTDDPNHQGADLTDSIMLISINTKQHNGFMLSIPRDLWVDIPSLGHEKINAANTVTNFSMRGYPNGGMGQLEDIITNDMGIPIDYYGLIDYTAFRDAVNAVGGITITINSPDPRGLYDPNTNLNLPNGKVTLNGQEALNLARARGDGPGSYGFPQADFDRTQHQRQMLVAIKQKATSVGVLSNPAKISQLFSAIGNNVHTDLSLADVLRLAQLTKGISNSSMKSLTLSETGQNPLLINYQAPDGEDALIPAAGLDNFSQIRQYYDSLTGSTTASSVVSEAPTAVVLNASDVSGLAKKEGQVLTNEGFTVVEIANASTEYPSSMIIDNTTSSFPAASKALTTTFPHTTTTSTEETGEAGEAAAYSSDFVIVLGRNWDNSD